MSRHRNIHNLTEDDYYDDYYDEDDYYEEDYYNDDDEYYREQERLRKEEEAERERKKKEAALLARLKTDKNNASTKRTNGKVDTSSKLNGSTAPQISERERNEKERLVTCMGFSSDEAREALSRNQWDAQKAINDLLTGAGGSSGLSGPSKGGVMAAPPGFSKPNLDTTVKMAPLEKTKDSSNGNTTQKGKLPSIDTKGGTQNETLSGKKSISKESHLSSGQVPKKKVAPELLKRLKAQKSRLSMVILGHVDAGK